MAKATVKTVTHTTVEKVTLELTPDEAAFMYGLVSKICGNDSGPRKHATALYHAFGDTDISPMRFKYFEMCFGNLWISDRTDHENFRPGD